MFTQNLGYTHIDGIYIPNMEAAIAVFAYELLDTYVADLIKNGKLNKEVLNYISIDRSNDLLKNLSLSPNKKEILHKAFEACPYNLQVYEKSLICNFMDYDTYQTARCFKQGTNIMASLLRKLGEASYPTTFRINYDVAEKIAELTRNDVVSVLQPKVDDYADAVVNAYESVVEMLSKREVATKVMSEFSEAAIFGGSTISKGKASAYVSGIVPQKVWDDLTGKCGYTNLLNRIKAQVPGADNVQTKREVDLILEEKLYPFFETARNEIVTKITIAKAAEEKRKAEEKILEQNRRARNKKMAIIITPIIIAAIVFAVVLNSVIIPNNKYKQAVELYNNGNYSEAIEVFSALDDHEDAAKHIGDCYIQLGDYESAVNAYGTTDIVIPDGVTNIPADAFNECDTLTSITIPSSVTSIGIDAFNKCENLENVYISDLEKWCAIKFDSFTSNPMHYGSNLYLNGNLVTDVVIPDSVTTINDYAFASWDGLTSVDLGGNVTTIGNSAFFSCQKLEEIILPNSITVIEDYAFQCCFGLTEIVIPDNVTKIGVGVFDGCKSLAEIVIPDSVATIGENAFSNCDSLVSISIPNSISRIEKYTFNDCNSLEEVTLPNSITYIGEFAFEHCNDLTNIEYDGTIYDWNSIDKEFGWAAFTGEYTIHFSDAQQSDTLSALSECKIGSTIVWGTYEQDNNLNNGPEAIKWKVLVRDDSKALVISEYCLEQLSFNKTLAPVTWETCSLRKWLNNDFWDSAFSEEEQTRIIPSEIPNVGNHTQDKVFLLSEQEAAEYLFKFERQAEATEYVSTDNCYWFLRTTGSQSNVAYVDYDGELGYYENVDRNWWIRPAMWIRIGD